MILGITPYYIENKIKSLNQECKTENAVITSVYDNQELIKIFKEYDTNQDGSISKEELINLYKKVMNAAKAEE